MPHTLKRSPQDEPQPFIMTDIRQTEIPQMDKRDVYSQSQDLARHEYDNIGPCVWHVNP